MRFDMWRLILLIAAVGLSPLLSPAPVSAQVLDPFDPFDIPDFQTSPEVEESKNPDDLVFEAALLLEDQRLLDARTKLLKALKKDPEHLRAHLMLAGYYLAHVGHFRLAHRYVTRAQEIFQSLNGSPPYSDDLVRQEHAQILYILSQVKLDLDDYQGALGVLDEFTGWRYYASWYPASRAWILMKLGRMEEAIKIARLGLLAGADFGRTINILGILLSMNGDVSEALEIFKQAIEFEFSQGPQGQPATPLNNSGEVYKEAFLEEKAESAWLRATSLPDGCEHVLPSLNLALLYIDQLNLHGAKRAIDNFESCVAQYPLRNGEEHKALVHFARGRIALHAGNIETARTAFLEALERRQWFGKIGTNQEDLEAAALLSLAEAERAYAQHSRQQATDDWRAFILQKGEALAAELRAWWYGRRARQILFENLNDFEDLHIRNTDSLLEYPTLGRMLSSVPTRQIMRRINSVMRIDKRPEAAVFYKSYLAEHQLTNGPRREGLELFGQVVASLRPRFDDLLRVHLLLVRLESLDPDSKEYATIAGDVFSYARPALRSRGFQLPVTVAQGLSQLGEYLEYSPFKPAGSRTSDYTLSLGSIDGEFVLEFSSRRKNFATVRVRGREIPEILNKLADEVFTIPLDD